jgi:hypothetical protein
MQQRTPARHVWVTGHVSQKAGLSSEITMVSAAPSGLVRGCIATHGWRRGLHSCAASRLGRRLLEGRGMHGHPRLAPWAAFLRRFAAGPHAIGGYGMHHHPRLTPWAAFLRRFAGWPQANGWVWDLET